MPTEVRATSIGADPATPCVITGKFTLDGKRIGERFRISFVVEGEKACDSNFFGFLPFVDSCDDPDIEIQARVQSHIPDLPAIYNYLFDVELVDEPRSRGNCKLFFLRVA